MDIRRNLRAGPQNPRPLPTSRGSEGWRGDSVYISSDWQFRVPFTSKLVQQAITRPREPPSSTDISTLTQLPSNALENILVELSANFLLRLAVCCRTLLEACTDDGLWGRMCLGDWGVGSEGLAQFRMKSHRALHRLLSLYAPLQGCWQLLQDYPFGSLLVVRFQDGLLVAECENGQPDKAPERSFCIEFTHETAPEERTGTGGAAREEEECDDMWGGGGSTVLPAAAPTSSEAQQGEKLVATAWVYRHREHGGGSVCTAGLARVVARPTQRVPVYGPLQYHFQHHASGGKDVYGEWLHSDMGLLEVSWGGSIEEGLAGLWWPPPDEKGTAGASERLERARGAQSKVLEQTTEWAEAHHEQEETNCPLLTLLPLPTILAVHENKGLLQQVQEVGYELLPLPGMYSGDYGAQYGLRRHEVVMVQYVKGPRIPGEAREGERLGGDGRGSEVWWLVGYKCTGDLHVPMGRCSFRVCLDAGLNLTPPTPLPANAAVSQPDNDPALAGWEGHAQVAFPGHWMPNWLPGRLTHYSSGAISFFWANLNSTVVYRPLTLSSDLFLGRNATLSTLAGIDRSLLGRAASLHVPLPDDHGNQSDDGD